MSAHDCHECGERIMLPEGDSFPHFCCADHPNTESEGRCSCCGESAYMCADCRQHDELHKMQCPVGQAWFEEYDSTPRTVRDVVRRLK